MGLPEYRGPIRAVELEDRLVLEGVGLFNLEYTVECGQAFRWYWMGNYYEGVVGGKVVRISQENDTLTIYPPFDGGTAAAVIGYFNLQQDSAAIEEALRNRDEYLSEAVSNYPGMKILRQEAWECLISYIISARNNIPAIKRAIAAISQKFGDSIPGTALHGFPTVEQLALAPYEELLECRTAFRTRYILDTARLVYEGKLDLDRLRGMDLIPCRENLQVCPGVGPKVADCTMLFSLDHYDSFPIDVWIGRAMRHYYFGGEEVSLKTIGEYATREFGDLAGYANQHLFFHARNIKIGRRQGAS